MGAPQDKIIPREEAIEQLQDCGLTDLQAVQFVGFASGISAEAISKVRKIKERFGHAADKGPGNRLTIPGAVAELEEFISLHVA